MSADSLAAILAAAVAPVLTLFEAIVEALNG